MAACPSFLSLALISLFLTVVFFCSRRYPTSLGWRLSRSIPVLMQRSLSSRGRDTKSIIQHIHSLAECHETAAILSDLIRQDGAGHWPPRANHDCNSWPAPLRSYSKVYRELETQISTDTPSLDDEFNRNRINGFRERFRELLSQNVDLDQVRSWLIAAEAGQWNIFPRDTYNAFWCCIAMSRHVYRWGTLPVVSVAQLEQELQLPVELDEPWDFLQRRFGCVSKSGNVTSNVIHNFDVNGRYVYRVNEGFPDVIPSEEGFMRIMREVEAHALPLYHDIVLAIIAFSQHDAASCALHMSHITRHLEPLLSQYYSRMHNKSIARSFWLSYVQGIHAWGLAYTEAASDSVERTKHNGLSGNQLLAFQLLDAFLGIEPYLSKTDRERAMPLRQQSLIQTIQKHCFRYRLDELGNGNSEAEKAIQVEFAEIVKRLRMFRAAHRRRGHAYLLQPAAERLPMTAGKGLLGPSMDESMILLDKFMVGRLTQTV